MVHQKLNYVVFLLLCPLALSRDNPKNGGGGVKTRTDDKSQPSGFSSQHNLHTTSEVGGGSGGSKMSKGREHKKAEVLGNCDKHQPEVPCSDLDEECLVCELNENCRYGQNMTVPCKVKDGVECAGNAQFKKEIVCQYCYQTPLWQQVCNSMKGCNSAGAPRNYYTANCTVGPKVICLGNRWFGRQMPCKWKNGYRWSTTFVLSVTLGGFGADRFYLGRWQEGIGKLFSFGGLGIWTIIDIILIGVRYLGPADGSLYVD